MPAKTRMDELSESFSRALFVAFPDWQQFTRSVEDDETGARCIEVDVPQEGTDRKLHLSTAGDQITIAFDRWHTHVGPFLGISTAESVAMAINMIESFITEQAVVKISSRDGVQIESSLEYLAAASESEPDSTTRIFSWGGTYDRTIETS